MLATTYINAQRVRMAWKLSLKEAMRDVDLIVTPTLPNTAMKVGDTTSRIGWKEESVFAVSARFVAPFNMSGLPAASIPCGRCERASHRSSDCRQVVRRRNLLQLGHAFERDTDYHLKRPRLPGLGDCAAVTSRPVAQAGLPSSRHLMRKRPALRRRHAKCIKIEKAKAIADRHVVTQAGISNVIHDERSRRLLTRFASGQRRRR